jgi:hypothetical protein
MKGPSPLLGYNTNVRHAGKLYHIQTEDSGVKHPHVITHLFADGGRIVASKKTTYAEHVGADDFQKIVKQLMRAQHKDMFIALRDGVYDDEAPMAATASGAVSAPAAPEPASEEVDIDLDVEVDEPSAPVDLDALDAAAAAFGDLPGTGEHPRPATNQESPGLYQSTRPAVEVAGRKDAERSESIFGSDLLSEKSLDEVILSYLAEDLEDAD